MQDKKHTTFKAFIIWVPMQSPFPVQKYLLNIFYTKGIALGAEGDTC